MSDVKSKTITIFSRAFSHAFSSSLLSLTIYHWSIRFDSYIHLLSVGYVENELRFILPFLTTIGVRGPGVGRVAYNLDVSGVY